MPITQLRMSVSIVVSPRYRRSLSSRNAIVPKSRMMRLVIQNIEKSWKLWTLSDAILQLEKDIPHRLARREKLDFLVLWAFSKG